MLRLVYFAKLKRMMVSYKNAKLKTFDRRLLKYSKDEIIKHFGQRISESSSHQILNEYSDTI